jgi:protocatechuate 3,4-dioxygenase beta subunit
VSGSIDRRKALSLLGGASLGVLVTACGAKTPTPSAASPSASASASGTDAATAASCMLTPEATEGPYYINLNLIRADISEGKAGTPLKLAMTVQDATTCKPIANAAVDVWHCDAAGVYSGYGAASTGGVPGAASSPTDKLTFLRGVKQA